MAGTMRMLAPAPMPVKAVPRSVSPATRQCFEIPRSQQNPHGCAYARTVQPRQRPFSSVRRSAAVACRAAASGPLKVAVTGAGGRTGGLTVKRLLAEPDKYSVVAVVRSQESAGKLEGVPDDAVFVADVASDSAADALAQAFRSVQALVIATSAVPKVKQPPTSPPEFYYEPGQEPERVDWLGQKLQIDAAKAAGISKVVLVGSMGGTDENNRLNAIGNGKILVFKRKAEEYLIASGINYTILHPGGLIDEKGGDRELVLGVDDELIRRAETEGTSRRIPRDDVAALAVAALTLPSADNRSVDAVAKEPGDGQPTTDFDALYLAMSANCTY